MTYFKLFTFLLLGLLVGARDAEQETEYFEKSDFLNADIERTQENQLGFMRTLRRKNCPCQCAKKEIARKQCRKFATFCAVSKCEVKSGKSGARCCQKETGGFGRCECLSNRYTIAVSFRSELAARVLLADLCAIKKTCPPNCNCNGCPLFNVLCISFKAPAGHKGWACSGDCRGAVTTCKRIPGK